MAWDGEERREFPGHCLAHSAQVEKTSAMQKNLRLTATLLVMAMLALFVVPLIWISKSDDHLNAISKEQVSIAGSIKAVDTKIDTWINANDKRIGYIEKEMSDRHDTIQRMQEKTHTHSFQTN